MNEIVYKKISTELQPVLPIGWAKVVLYAEINENSFEIFYYCFLSGSAGPIQCYDLPKKYDITEKKVDFSINQIATVLKKEYTSESNKWSVLTFILERNGRFEVEFDYSDLSDGSYDFKKMWREKYIL